MRPRPGETRAGCEPPSRQNLQIPRWRGPTASGVRCLAAFPRRAPCAGARFRLSCGFGWSCPFSVRPPEAALLMAVGDCQLERSAPSCFRFHPDPSALALDNFLTDRKTDARTGNFAPMQAFEHAENPVGVLRIDTDSVVAHGKQPPSRIS